MRRACFLFLVSFGVTSAQPTAEEIMARVAENQDKAEAARTAWVYDMKVFVRLLRSGGKVVDVRQAWNGHRRGKHQIGAAGRNAAMPVRRSGPVDISAQTRPREGCRWNRFASN